MKIDRSPRNLRAQSLDPPSTGMLAPVIHRAPSEARKAIASATSDGLPMRFDIGREEAVEIRDRVVLNCRSFGDAGVGDKNVQSVADQGADLLRERICSVCGRKIGLDR